MKTCIKTYNLATKFGEIEGGNFFRLPGHDSLYLKIYTHTPSDTMNAVILDHAEPVLFNDEDEVILVIEVNWEKTESRRREPFQYLLVDTVFELEAALYLKLTNSPMGTAIVLATSDSNEYPCGYIRTIWKHDVVNVMDDITIIGVEDIVI
jgi:hypothetical protein